MLTGILADISTVIAIAFFAVVGYNLIVMPRRIREIHRSLQEILALMRTDTPAPEKGMTPRTSADGK